MTWQSDLLRKGGNEIFRQATRKDPHSLLDDFPPPTIEPLPHSESTRVIPASVTKTTRVIPASVNEIPDQQEFQQPVDLPTTEETVRELRRRLAMELYQIEEDLKGGGRIANKPCDCLGYKHHFGIIAKTNELLAYDTDPVYKEILDWYEAHAPEFEITAIANHEPEYYQELVPEVRMFRKRVVQTLGPGEA